MPAGNGPLQTTGAVTADARIESQAAESNQTPARESEPGSYENAIGPALFAGGFRAALFALGTLWRLNECGWLRKLTHITSVSGGWFTAGYLALYWKQLAFNANGVAKNVSERIGQPIERFCGLHIDAPHHQGGIGPSPSSPYRHRAIQSLL